MSHETTIAAAVAAALEAFWATLYYRFPEAARHRIPSDVDNAFTFYATQAVTRWLIGAGVEVDQ